MPLAPPSKASSKSILAKPTDRYEPVNKWTEDGDVVHDHAFSRRSFLSLSSATPNTMAQTHRPSMLLDAAQNHIKVTAWKYLDQSPYYKLPNDGVYVTFYTGDSFNFGSFRNSKGTRVRRVNLVSEKKKGRSGRYDRKPGEIEEIEEEVRASLP